MVLVLLLVIYTSLTEILFKHIYFIFQDVLPSCDKHICHITWFCKVSIETVSLLDWAFEGFWKVYKHEKGNAVLLKMIWESDSLLYDLFLLMYDLFASGLDPGWSINKCISFSLWTAPLKSPIILFLWKTLSKQKNPNIASSEKLALIFSKGKFKTFWNHLDYYNA